jgi:hypothetical protein
MAPIAAISPFLGQIGGREIDGDAAGRQSEPRSDQRRAHPFARLTSMPSKATVATRWTISGNPPSAQTSVQTWGTDRA